MKISIKNAFQWASFYGRVSNAVIQFYGFLWCEWSISIIYPHSLNAIAIKWVRYSVTSFNSCVTSWYCHIHYFGNCLISVHIRPQMKLRNEIKIFQRAKYIFAGWESFFVCVAATPSDDCSSGSYLLLIQFTSILHQTWKWAFCQRPGPSKHASDWTKVIFCSIRDSFMAHEKNARKRGANESEES